MTDPTGPGSTMRRISRLTAVGLVCCATALPARLTAQSIEGSKWNIEQEGVETTVLWWLGSQGRVRTGDIGAILPGYKWRQAGDSVIVTVGDTVRFAGVLMSNRLVGVRSGPRRQEGWWSGARADGPTAVAAAPTPPSGPQVNPAAPNTEPMSRPTATPPRQLRRIEREGESSRPAPTQAAGEGREVRRLPRPGAGAAARSTPAVPLDPTAFFGVWVHTNPNTGIRVELRADSTVSYVRRDVAPQSGRWTTEGGGLLIRVDLIGGGEKEVLVRVEGDRLTMQPRGGLLSLTLDRARTGPEREPAVRQP